MMPAGGYLLQRIARKRPDILARYERGEFKSVRAAAIEAGIVRKPWPFGQVMRLLSKLSPAEIAHVHAVTAPAGSEAADARSDGQHQDSGPGEITHR